MGFILATWDKVMVELVEELARVFADTPARVIDFLSMASSQDFESEQSYQLMTTLIYMDEKAAAPLANKIESIRSVERAYKLDELVRDARKSRGSEWKLRETDVASLLEEAEEPASEA